MTVLATVSAVAGYAPSCTVAGEGPAYLACPKWVFALRQAVHERKAEQRNEQSQRGETRSFSATGASAPPQVNPAGRGRIGLGCPSTGSSVSRNRPGLVPQRALCAFTAGRGEAIGLAPGRRPRRRQRLR